VDRPKPRCAENPDTMNYQKVIPGGNFWPLVGARPHACQSKKHYLARASARASG
jgi:hypothetical protein